MHFDPVTRSLLPVVVLSLLLHIVSAWNIASAQVWMPVPEIGRDPVSDLLERDGVLYAATLRIVYRSSDGGASWTAAEEFPRVDPYADVTSLAAWDDLLFAGSSVDGVSRSSDGGRHWTRYSDGLAGDSESIFDLAVRGDTLFAATDGAGIWARDIRSSSPWRPYNAGLSWGGASRLVAYGDLLCALVTDFAFVQRAGDWQSLPWNEFGSQRSAFSLHVHGDLLFGGTFTGMYRWNGSDQRWTPLSLAPAPDRGVMAFTSHGARLFAVLQLSYERHLIVESTDAGDTWSVRDDTQGESHALLVTGGRLWSARTDGLWYRPLDGTASVPPTGSAAGMALHSPYPHPVGKVSSVVFELPVSDAATLTVRDVLGRVRAVLADGESLDAGLHRRALALADLPPGCYLLSLETGRGIVSRPFVLR